MADQYFVGRDGKRCGPFSVAQLRRIAADGRLLLTDTIWRAGRDEPVLAARVKDLFPLDRGQTPAAVAVEAPAAVAPSLALVAVAEAPALEIPAPINLSAEGSLSVPG